MSILLAAATTQTVPTAGEWIELVTFAIAALMIAYMAGVFRRRSVVGPPRVPPEHSAGTLWLTALAGFGGMLVTQTMYLAILKIPPPLLSLHQTVVLSVLGTAVGLGIMLLGHTIWGPATAKQLGFSPERIPRGLLAGLLGSCVAIPLMFVASMLVQEIWRRAGFSPPEEHILLKVFGESAVPIDRVLVVVSAVILAPLFEELLFRAHIQTALVASLGRAAEPALARWAGIAIAAALFALVHGVWWMMPPLFLLAVCLGYAYERTGNLWASIVMHGMFNAVSLLVEYVSLRGH